jgi:hypothetical protein
VILVVQPVPSQLVRLKDAKIQALLARLTAAEAFAAAQAEPTLAAAWTGQAQQQSREPSGLAS